MVDLKNDTLNGTNNRDKISYDVFLNGTVFALAGDDSVAFKTVQGGLIDLGEGNDKLWINQFTNLKSQDRIVIDGNTGSDILYLKQYKAEDLQWYWADQVGWKLRNKDGTLDYAIVKNVENIWYAGGIKAKLTTEKMIKSNREITIGKMTTTGTAGVDVITAFVGDQTDAFIRTGKGNDTINLYSSFSAESNRLSFIDGGAGIDTLFLSDSTDAYKFEFISGKLYLQTYVKGTWSNIAQLTGIENITFKNEVTGTIGSNGVSLLAPRADTSLFGTSGGDTFTGGSGDDTITPFTGNDVIDLRAGGSDLVLFSSDLYSASLTEVTVYGRQRDDTFLVDGYFKIISDLRSYNSNEIQVGDVTICWTTNLDNGPKTIFHFKE